MIKKKGEEVGVEGGKGGSRLDWTCGNGFTTQMPAEPFHSVQTLVP